MIEFKDGKSEGYDLYLHDYLLGTLIWQSGKDAYKFRHKTGFTEWITGDLSTVRLTINQRFCEK